MELINMTLKVNKDGMITQSLILIFIHSLPHSITHALYKYLK